VEKVVSTYNPTNVLRAIERFVVVGQRWLKIAGGVKADLLEAAIRHTSFQSSNVCAELGSFVGYTSTRLGLRLLGHCQHSPRVTSLEFDIVHVCISRHISNIATLAHVTETWAGHVPLITPRLAEVFGERSIGFTFMDHKGTRFHEDHHHLDKLSLLAASSCTICDNVVHPGAPEYVWGAKHSFMHTCYSLPEFAQQDLEDWQAVHMARFSTSGRPALAVQRSEMQT